MKGIKFNTEQIAEIRQLAALGYTEAEIAEQYFNIRHETFSRIKARDKAVKEAIHLGRFSTGMKAQEAIEYIMEYATVEKNRLAAAMYLHNRYAKLQNALETPTNIQINFADSKKTKTKDQIEKEAEEFLKDETDY